MGSHSEGVILKPQKYISLFKTGNSKSLIANYIVPYPAFLSLVLHSIFLLMTIFLLHIIYVGLVNYYKHLFFISSYVE